jgi:hypothetical protein
MPTTLVGLVLFVVLLAPGLIFFLVRDARKPARELSAFRETAVVVLVGFLCDIVVLLVFALFRTKFVSLTPDVDALVKHPATYIGDHLPFVSWWSLGLVSLACVVGGALGRFDEVRRPGFKKAFPWLTCKPLFLGPIRFRSTWYLMMHEPRDVDIYCGCVLDDGSYIGGKLASFNTDVAETEDRELVLVQPMRFRAPDADEVQDWRASAVVVNAHHLRLLQIDYVDRGVEPAAVS